MTEVEGSFKSVADLHRWAVLLMFFRHERAARAAIAEIEQTYQKRPKEIGRCQLAWLQCYMDRRLFLRASSSGGVEPLSPAQINGNLARLRTTQRLFGETSKRFPHLHQIGLWHALSEVLTPGAVAKIRESGTFYHCIANNPSASEWGIFWLRQASVLGSLFTFRPDTAPHGLTTLVELLEDKLSPFAASGRLAIHMGAEVIQVEPAKRPTEVVLRVEQQGPDGHVKHSFNLRCDDVILALPQLPLRTLQEHFPEPVKSRIEGVEALPLLKAFVVTKKPWWPKHFKAQSYAWRVPTRELHFFRGEDPDCPSLKDPNAECKCGVAAGMIMLYSDQPALHYWDVLLTPEDRRRLIWKSADLGSADSDTELLDITEEFKDNCVGALNGGELEHNRYGVFDMLVRRLLLVPHPGLPGQINDRCEVIKRRLGTGLRQQLRDQEKSFLGFSEQIVALLETTNTSKYKQYNGVIREAMNKALEPTQVPDDWFDALDKALALRRQGFVKASQVREAARAVVAYGIRDWSAEPFGGAAHLWKPGWSATVSDTEEPLFAFALRERSDSTVLQNVHICGEAYSGHQGFIEGALETAAAVVDAVAKYQVSRGSLPSNDEIEEQATVFTEERRRERDLEWQRRVKKAQVS
jgi:hypothetical protein